MILGLKQMTVNSAKNRDESRTLVVIMLMKSLVNTVGPHLKANLCHSLTKLTKTGIKHKVRLSTTPPKLPTFILISVYCTQIPSRNCSLEPKS